jgi:hypothetical protein
MDEATQYIVHSNPRAMGRRKRIGPRLRRPQVETSMGPGLVVVGGVSPEHSLQVVAAEHQHPVQALGPDSTDPPLGEGVRPRGSDRGLDDLCALGAEHLVERTGELGIPVPDQEPDSFKAAPPQPGCALAG